MKKSMMKAKVSGSSETSVSGLTHKSGKEAGNSCQPQKTAWKDTQEGRKPMGTSRETTKVVKTAKAVTVKKAKKATIGNGDHSFVEIWTTGKGVKTPITISIIPIFEGKHEVMEVALAVWREKDDDPTDDGHDWYSASVIGNCGWAYEGLQQELLTNHDFPEQDNDGEVMK